MRRSTILNLISEINYFCFCSRSAVVSQLLNKEPLKPGSKPPVVPSFTSAHGVDNANQESQSTENKNIHSHNTVKQKSALTDEQSMNESKILNDHTFKMRFINKIENWSPSTAKYARLGIFGCKVSINHL